MSWSVAKLPPSKSSICLAVMQVLNEALNLGPRRSKDLLKIYKRPLVPSLGTITFRTTVKKVLEIDEKTYYLSRIKN